MTRQDNRVGFAFAEHILELLGKADDGHICKADTADDLECARELAFSTVDNDQVGERFFQLTLTSEYDFIHRAEIVGFAFYRAQTELAVVALFGTTAFEYDH